jgi:transposase, IS5 family
MKSSSPDASQTQFLAPGLKELLNPKEPLYRLADAIDWSGIEAELSPLYADFGRPAKPIRLMVGLNLLKHLYNLGDETVVAAWVQNPYYQYFTGETVFQWKPPVAPSDMVHFRKRVGEKGIERVLAATLDIHDKKAREEDEVIIDTTAQEKNIAHPVDAKLYARIIEHCWRIADAEGIALRQRYTRVRKHALYLQRFHKSRTRHRDAVRGRKRLRIVAGRLSRELLRKIPKSRFGKYAPRFDVFFQVLHQKKGDKDKVYSIHEPDVYCMAKGKAHKKYEFGCKVSLITTKSTGLCVGAVSFAENLYDGHTLPKALEQYERLMDKRPKVALVDLGYRGTREVQGTQILEAGRIRGMCKGSSAYYRMRKRLARRSAIEPEIGHMKARFRLGRNFLKGTLGDAINVMLAGAASNLRKWMRRVCRRLFWADAAGMIAAWRRRLATVWSTSTPMPVFQGSF